MYSISWREMFEYFNSFFFGRNRKNLVVMRIIIFFIKEINIILMENVMIG